MITSLIREKLIEKKSGSSNKLILNFKVMTTDLENLIENVAPAN